MTFDSQSLGPLPPELQARLNMIIQTVPSFWSNNKHHNHFTNHGPEHSERVLNQKLAQLAQELPESSRLTPDEIFIVSAAAWLYETGMQSPDLEIIGVDFRPGDSLSFSQLQEIRENRHLLTERLIINSVRRDSSGPPLQLGLTSPGDDYTSLIAEVCRLCSNEPLENVAETTPVRGVPVRVRLLVALLRLADRLYIDGSRVNRDLLERADLPKDQFARWWAYSYAQVLPIVGGQIRFYYFMPVTQKEYLGHIRALIEPQFKHENNPILRYLFAEGLRLVPHVTPSFKFDQPAGFQWRMAPELITYLRREIVPMEVPSEILPVLDEEPEERCLLLLDYENFILQLGQEGHFFTLDEIGDLVVDLLTEARGQYGRPVDGVAIGPWDRPDLAGAAQVLEEVLFQLLSPRAQENLSQMIERELTQCLQGLDTPPPIILVAPSKALAPTIKGLAEKKKIASVWLSHLHEARVYRVVVQQTKYLRDLLKLPAKEQFDASRLRNAQNACILRIQDEVIARGNEFSYEKIQFTLSQVEQVNGRAGWWRLWLLNQGILVAGYSKQQHFVRLNIEHSNVSQVRAMCEVVIRALEAPSDIANGVRQNRLLQDLRQSPQFRTDESALGFLGLLQKEGIVQVDARPSLPDGQPLWYLNASHRIVIVLTKDRYLTRFALALDHVLVREGHPFLHEHNLTKQLSPYMGRDVVEYVYKMAVDAGLVRCRKSFDRKYQRDVVNVNLAAEHRLVGKMMHDREILLDILYRKPARDGLERGTLWARLEGRGSMSIPAELDHWLAFFERDSIVTVTSADQDLQRDVIRLNLDTLLTQHLLGRMHIHGLIRNMRIMRATRPDSKKPSGELLERLTKFVVRHDEELAGWTLAYAKDIRLVKSEGDLVFLNRHNIVSRLDRRERPTCRALAEMIDSLGQGRRDGWVPKDIVLAKMKNHNRFGFVHGEHEYWLSQATFRLRLLEERKGKGPRSVRVAKKKRP